VSRRDDRGARQRRASRRDQPLKAHFRSRGCGFAPTSRCGVVKDIGERQHGRRTQVVQELHVFVQDKAVLTTCAWISYPPARGGQQEHASQGDPSSQ
jgi:hypothetical protein